ncbi:MAG: hypothetical protein IPK26_20050 [Planctomycetes bacterium]|nr:hypothetical protein [Planctomycetota bacterium]
MSTRFVDVAWFSLLLAGAVAQGPAPVLGAEGPFRSVFVSDPYEDGSIWVRGHRYKLGLLGDRATFQPLFGPRAPRDYPLTLALRDLRVGGEHVALAAGVATRAGERRLEVDRGPVVERWDLMPEAARQSFVVTEPLGHGPLVVELAVTTAMAFGGRDADGLRFVAPNELGSVHYSDAVIIDGKGRRLSVPVSGDAASIRIEVPAAFAAAASWPLLIDPLLQTFAVDTSVSQTEDPRVAYDEGSDTWLVVAEEHLSATDIDIRTTRYFAATNPPALAETSYAHNTPSRTLSPEVANLAPVGMFAISWHNSTENNGCFQYRRRTANSMTMSTIGTTSVGLNGTDLCRALVGGCRSGNRWLLAMLRQNSTGQDILFQTLSTTGTAFGTAFGTFPLSGSHVGDVSMTAGPGDPWVLVWTECAGRCTTLPLRMQAVDLNGNLPLPQAPVQLALGPDRSPSIAGWGGQWLVTWTHGGDIQGMLLGNSGGTVAPTTGPIDLTLQEPGVDPALVQFNARAAFDGCRYSYSYIETDSLGVQQPFAATVHVQGTTLSWHDGHAALSPATTIMGFAIDSAAMTRPGVAGPHLVVWDEQSAPFADSDLRAATYNAIQSGPLVVVDQTGCGAPEAPFTVRGTPAIGQSFQILTTPNGGFPFILVGTRSIVPLPGCGSCQSGIALPAAFTFPQAALNLTVPCDVSYLGFAITCQAALLLEPGGCPPQVFGAPVTVTDTLTITVR